MTHSKVGRRLAACAVTAMALAVMSGCTGHSAYLYNGTQYTLTPYPLVSKPPPPHHVADPANAIAPNTEEPIDMHGTNPVFYAAGITDPKEPNGVYFKFFFYQAKGPWPVQYRIYHYLVPPGQEGKDLDKQPILLDKGSLQVPMFFKLKVEQIPKPRAGSSWTVSLKP